jgi:hypothetical protein
VRTTWSLADTTHSRTNSSSKDTSGNVSDTCKWAGGAARWAGGGTLGGGQEGGGGKASSLGGCQYDVRCINCLYNSWRGCDSCHLHRQLWLQVILGLSLGRTPVSAAACVCVDRESASSLKCKKVGVPHGRPVG